MIKTILFDMGGTLEDIWYNDQTIRTVTGELRTFLDEHDLGTGCNDITFWNKLNQGYPYLQTMERIQRTREKTGGNLAGVLYGGLQSEP